VTFLDKDGKLTPSPRPDVSVRKGMKAIIYGYYNDL
jgi:hypothetical protein